MSKLSLINRDQKRLRFGIGLRRRGDGDVHAPQNVDLVVLDLRENDLFLDAHVVVAAAIERTSGNTAKVAHARQ